MVKVRGTNSNETTMSQKRNLILINDSIEIYNR